jgi:hypothetical protein
MTIWIYEKIRRFAYETIRRTTIVAKKNLYDRHNKTN